jgi:hypothetical protein
MRRSTLLTIAALLLLGASLGSATPPPPPTPSTDVPVLEMQEENMTAATSSCKTLKIKKANAAPTPQFMVDQLCGSCSPVPCKNAVRGTPCGGGFGKRCEYYLDLCAEDSLADCRCYAGPIP